MPRLRIMKRSCQAWGGTSLLKSRRASLAWKSIPRLGSRSARVRRYRLNRFPYGLVYAVLDNEIVIVAIMHLHRKPDYWQAQTTET
jgi:hypothetical protein